MTDLAAHLAELKAKAQKATPGPWTTREGQAITVRPPTVGSPEWLASLEVCADTGSRYGLIPHGITHRTDAEFIAAANPQAVLALIAVAEQSYERHRMDARLHVECLQCDSGDMHCPEAKALVDLEAALGA